MYMCEAVKQQIPLTNAKKTSYCFQSAQLTIYESNAEHSTQHTKCFSRTANLGYDISFFLCLLEINYHVPNIVKKK